MNLLFHADDFGISPNQSKTILSCWERGLLNSTSLMMNSPHIEACIDLLPQEDLAKRPQDLLDAQLGKSSLLVGCHINLVEGPSLSGHTALPLITDERGYFCQSFAGLLKLSTQNTAEFLDELRIEIGAQIDAFVRVFPFACEALRIDSHQHTHMIPAVLHALCDVITTRRLHVWYMRTPVEFWHPYLTVGALGNETKIPPINGVKVALLNALWRTDSTLASRYGITRIPFVGVMLSGHMDFARVEKFGPELMRRAAAYTHVNSRLREESKQGAPSEREVTAELSAQNLFVPSLPSYAIPDVEFLFHPGGITDVTQEALDPTKPDFISFYISPMRAQEAACLTDSRLFDLMVGLTRA